MDVEQSLVSVLNTRLCTKFVPSLNEKINVSSEELFTHDSSYICHANSKSRNHSSNANT